MEETTNNEKKNSLDEEEVKKGELNEANIENMKAEVEEKIVEKEIDEVSLLKQSIDEMQNRLLRTQADFENFKKRSRLEKEETAKYGTAKLIEALLPVYDNFARAIQSSSELKDLDSLIEGVQMVYRQLEEALLKEGLEPIEAIGQPFNPEYHQAVMQVETDKFEPNYVVEEFQKGYRLKGRVIRPSMVQVNI